MELRQLRYFVTVAEELHFGRAAERLHIVQSAVSQQVARLERELGVELVDRSPRRVRLTEAGAEFLPLAREVLAAEQRAKAGITEFRTRQGTVLRIGTSRGMGQRLELVLELLRARESGLELALGSAPITERVRRVADEEWDAAFARGELDIPAELRQVPVWQDELVVALPANHPMAGAARADFAQLARLPLYLVPRQDNPSLVSIVEKACAEAGFEPKRTPASSLQDTLATLAAGVAGWTVVYAEHAKQLRGGKVAFLPTDLALPTALILLERNSTRLRPLIEACARAARTDS
ncbi:LysR family transcriptional regulator [Nocardia arthritidis]|uniref:LysR family transcriptional regulator n=1 Tax=Nocardia arthritidis TaxID=228602 RepID=A0A6G9Y8G7_9NOCA|nr:LysR family transcriptional regulator [Nocardia arthritidis]QIS09509.1 LysR family transcriptional regulator [Nocardia arthritidis]